MLEVGRGGSSMPDSHKGLHTERSEVRGWEEEEEEEKGSCTPAFAGCKGA